MNFDGKVVLITGASSGIGANASFHFAKLGANVAIVGRNEERLHDVAEQIIEAGYSKPFEIVADVTEDTERIMNDTIEHFGQLDVLVNNAGIARSDSITNISMDNFDHVFDTNLRSVLKLTSLAIPHLKQTKGNIVNVSSVAGLKPFGESISYCISKAALDQFTKCAALGLASEGIRVNAINPAMIRTPIFESFGFQIDDLNEFCDKNASNYLVGRVGEVSDTSSAIAYLASETFINGITLPVDGGLLCSSTPAIKLD